MDYPTVGALLKGVWDGAHTHTGLYVHTHLLVRCCLLLSFKHSLGFVGNSTGQTELYRKPVQRFSKGWRHRSKHLRALRQPPTSCQDCLSFLITDLHHPIDHTVYVQLVSHDSDVNSTSTELKLRNNCLIFCGDTEPRPYVLGWRRRCDWLAG